MGAGEGRKPEEPSTSWLFVRLRGRRPVNLLREDEGPLYPSLALPEGESGLSGEPSLIFSLPAHLRREVGGPSVPCAPPWVRRVSTGMTLRWPLAYLLSESSSPFAGLRSTCSGATPR